MSKRETEALIKLVKLNNLYNKMFCLQMFPTALITGNTHILKPSERDPGATMFMMQLAQDAGFPDGTVNVIHGAHAGFCFFNVLKITDFQPCFVLKFTFN